MPNPRNRSGGSLVRAALLAAGAIAGAVGGVAAGPIADALLAGSCRGAEDTDADGVRDCLDNCPVIANNQDDADGDAIGDSCDCDLDVDTTADGDDRECAIDCTLREAIRLAPSNCMLRVAPGTYTLSLTGGIGIERGVTIVGSGAGQTIIERQFGGGFAVSSNVLEVVSVFIARLSMVGFTQAITLAANQPVPTKLTMSHVVFDQNDAAVRVSHPSCCYSASAAMNSCAVLGGATSTSAILVYGAEAGPSTLIVNDSEIEDAAGGAISVSGAGVTPMNAGRGIVELNRSTVRGNAGVSGAGIMVAGGTGSGRLGGRLVLRQSTLSGNSASSSGGGLWIGEGALGGGAATAEVMTSTISSNTAGSGGGIHNLGQTQLYDTTIVSNRAASAGGGLQALVQVSLRNTIVADNTDTAGAPDCAGALVGLTGGHNLIENAAGCGIAGDQNGNQIGIDPTLRPLGDYGGPTETHVPIAGSPAIEAGWGCSGRDQRGIRRPIGGCDIGAIEDAPDTDGDGVPDEIDGCPTVPGQTSPGSCGCGFDVDDDDVCDATDNCPGAANPGQADMDGDASGPPCDCDDADPTTSLSASEVNDGQDNQCPGGTGFGLVDEISGIAGFFDAGNPDEFSWPPQPGATLYQMARAASPDFVSGCTAFPATSSELLVDPAQPPPGVVLFYAVRAFAPHVGSWGASSAGIERRIACAP